MGKKNRRRPQQSRATAPAPDPRVQAVVRSVGDQLTLGAELLSADDPTAEAERRLGAAIGEVSTAIAQFDPVRVIEVARIGCLPWSHLPQTTDSERGLTRAEVVALLAVASHSGLAGAAEPAADDESGLGPLRPQPITDAVHGRMEIVDEILHLEQVKALLDADPEDVVGLITTKMRGAEVWMRNSSYPDRVEFTVRELFSDESIDRDLKAGLGFGVDAALRTLQGCHQMQVDRFNARINRWRHDMAGDMKAHPDGLNEEERTTSIRQWRALWEPESHVVTLSAQEVAEHTGLNGVAVQAILEFFALDLGGSTPRSVISAFAAGDNPLRTNPVIVGPDGRFMLVHDAHIVVAVREAFEQFLKGTPAWDQYQKHRGEVLEERTEMALSRVLPGATALHGFEYFVPATDAEGAGPVEGYTKRVEGDHLFVLDDVAIIVEDKAVAVAPAARAGDTRRLRNDLRRIIEGAISQARRLRDRIEADRGLRLEGSGWMDLSSVREIHIVAVSLEDLAATTTGTADLIHAGLVDKDCIAWTVSLHDLDLIVELIDHPSEFLLYLRRRTDPLATVLYTAPDELDLFLYFQQKGLYVEPDPDELRKKLPYLPATTNAERRHFKRQAPKYIPTLTDQLDAWHHQRTNSAANGTHTADQRPGVNLMTNPPAKPAMAVSPLRALLEDLQTSRAFAWLSIGATLLSGSTATQERMARIPHDLLKNPFDDGRGRSMTMPIADARGDGWLLAWITRPPTTSLDEFAHEMSTYIQAKAHQLGLKRAAAFLYDEATSTLARTLYESHLGDPIPEVLAALNRLQPANVWSTSPPPKAKSRAGGRSTAKRKVNRRRR
ncbi:MAG TPA: hypothetical protein PKD84_03810 [Propionicimonas sp.]|nr:hypothetical protein [Propionicimonas sp.]